MLVCLEDRPELGIKLLHDDEKGNDLIVLCPRLEEWLIAAVSRNGSEMERYHLPSSGVELHKIINKNLVRMEAILKDLEGSEEFARLGDMLATRFKKLRNP